MFMSLANARQFIVKPQPLHSLHIVTSEASPRRSLSRSTLICSAAAAPDTGVYPDGRQTTMSIALEIRESVLNSIISNLDRFFGS
jgi:hypothetical protein